MSKLRHFVLMLAIPAAAVAADQGLLRLVMPDAKVIAGIQVAQTRNSLFGQFVLSHMQLDGESFQKFIADTGFDPRRDVTEILIASNWNTSTPESRWLVLAKGVFDTRRIEHVAEENGVPITNFQGIDIYTYSGTAKPAVENALAFFDSHAAVMGDLASVKAAIERDKNGAAAGSQLLGKVRNVSAKSDFWFVTLVPLSEFAGLMPDPALSGAMQGNMLSAVNQTSGGIRFGDTVTITAEAVTRSDKDAQALVDVVKFVASLLQMNRQNNAAAGQVASWLDTLDCKTAGNVMSMSVAVPERQLEQMLESVQASGRPAPKKTPAHVN